MVSETMLEELAQAAKTNNNKKRGGERRKWHEKNKEGKGGDYLVLGAVLCAKRPLLSPFLQIQKLRLSELKYLPKATKNYLNFKHLTFS